MESSYTEILDAGYVPKLTATTLNADNTTSTKVLYDPADDTFAAVISSDSIRIKSIDCRNTSLTLDLLLNPLYPLSISPTQPPLSATRIHAFLLSPPLSR